MLGKIARRIWHDIFYIFATVRMVNFAMRCKDVAGQVDLDTTPDTKADRFRIALHISLCQGCKNYLSSKIVLKNAVKEAIFEAENLDRLSRLNNDLVLRHKKKI